MPATQSPSVQALSGSPLAAAIVHLEVLERELSTQLEATRHALQSIRGVVDPARVAIVATSPATSKPASPKSTAVAPRRDVTVREQAVHVTDDQVRAFLKGGPKSVSALEERFSLSRYFVRQLLQQLESRGVVVVSGKTTNRRVALPGAPAKEEP